MEENREISALLHLIDDPDEEVFSTVSARIVSFGKQIIPNLEHLWENTIDEAIQTKIELLIHRLHFRDLKEDFEQWAAAPHTELLPGALLVARYQYPELTVTPVLQEVEKLRRNIWLELNSYLTPLEQVNVITSIIYNYYQLKGVEIAYQYPNEFMINKVLETKRGNPITNGILYYVLCRMLDVPVRVVNIPRQFILAYFNEEFDIGSKQNPAGKIAFFIDPMTGQVFSHKDIESYFKRIAVPPTPTYYKPISDKRIIQVLIEEFSKCFDDERTRYKMQELASLSALLNE
jgi:regulator of sirC expression with transglutaminase-like and TPR domain